MTTLRELEHWFQSQCNGDWEHGSGVRVASLDNPGWSIDVDLAGTSVEGKQLKMTKTERTDQDWLWAWTEDGRFLIRCGPCNLEEGLRAFLDWCKK